MAIVARSDYGVEAYATVDIEFDYPVEDYFEEMSVSEKEQMMGLLGGITSNALDDDSLIDEIVLRGIDLSAMSDEVIEYFQSALEGNPTKPKTALNEVKNLSALYLEHPTPDLAKEIATLIAYL